MCWWNCDSLSLTHVTCWGVLYGCVVATRSVIVRLWDCNYYENTAALQSLYYIHRQVIGLCNLCAVRSIHGFSMRCILCGLYVVESCSLDLGVGVFRLFVAKTFHFKEQKVLIGNFRSQDLSFPGTFVSEILCSLETLFPGPFVPGNFRSPYVAKTITRGTCHSQCYIFTSAKQDM